MSLIKEMANTKRYTERRPKQDMLDKFYTRKVLYQ